jgi:hypothetical protein
MFQLGNLALSIQGMTESGTGTTSVKGCWQKRGYTAGPRRQKIGRQKSEEKFYI